MSKGQKHMNQGGKHLKTVQNSPRASRTTTVLQVIFASLAAITCLCISVVTMTNDEAESDREQRTLTTFSQAFAAAPEDATLEDRINTLTDAFSDQMAFRTVLSTIYYTINPVAIYSASTETVIGTEGEDVPESEVTYDDPDPGLQLFTKEAAFRTDGELEEEAVKIAALLNAVGDEVTQAGAQFIYLSVPRKDAVMTWYLPASYTSTAKAYTKELAYVEANLNDNIAVLDAYAVFKENIEKCPRPYLSVDHHMSVRGGWIVYCALMDIINGVNADTDESPSATTEDAQAETTEIVHKLDLDTDFEQKTQVIWGWFSDQLANSVEPDPEVINLVYKGELAYTRTINGETSDTPVFGTENRYRNFMGGNDAESIVTVEANKGKPTILFVGTSHILLQAALCVPSFYRVINIDYREMASHTDTYRDIIDYVNEYDVDYVVFCGTGDQECFNIPNYLDECGPKYANFFD